MTGSRRAVVAVEAVVAVVVVAAVVVRVLAPRSNTQVHRINQGRATRDTPEQPT